MVNTTPIAAEWLNENSLRAYPFREDAGLRPNDSTGNLVEGGWTLPNYLVTDFVLAVSGANMSPLIYLKRLSVVGGTVTLVFGNVSEDEVITVSAALASHTTNEAYQMAGTGTFSEARGVICIGDLARFFEETPEGVYDFSSTETQIEPTCVRPTASGVRTIAAQDASGYISEPLKGDVELVAGQNIRLDYDPDTNAITISADPNAGYSESCTCATAETGFVRSINGVRTEDVTIVGDDCVDVTTSDGIVKISDKCSKPCCGCAEVTFINQTINNLQTTADTLAKNVSSLDDRLASFINSYLLARKTLG